MCSICKEAHAGADFLAETVSWKRPILKQFMKDSILWEEPDAGAEEGCKKEGVADRKHYEPTTVPFSLPLACISGGGRIVKSEAEPGKNRSRGGRGEGGYFYFSLSNSSTNSCQ